MEPVVVSGAASRPLAAELVRVLDVRLAEVQCEHFPDGEQHVQVATPVVGARVVLVQGLRGPVGEPLLELLLLADACRRAGAAELTLVLPYLAYARQDRRGREGEALGVRVLADVLATAAPARLVAVDLHAEALEGCFAAPLTHLHALEALLPAVRALCGDATVVVSPDLGGVKRAERCARALGLPLAVVHKERRSAREVAVHRLVGEVAGRRPLLVDDLVSTGGTLAAATQALLHAGCDPDVTVVATHALLAGDAAARLAAAGVRRLVTTDSVALPPQLPLPAQVVGLAPLLAGALRPLLG